MQVGQSSENDSDTDLEPEGILLLLQLFLDVAVVDFTYPLLMDGIGNFFRKKAVILLVILFWLVFFWRPANITED